jgi:prepilin peptidase CpaA
VRVYPAKGAFAHFHGSVVLGKSGAIDHVLLCHSVDICVTATHKLRERMAPHMNDIAVSLLDALTRLATDPRSASLVTLLVVAGAIDFRTMRIPNWLTYGGAVFGLLFNAVVPAPVQPGVLWALGGLALGLVLLLPLYALRVMGAGDVKLMAMAGAFLGLPHTIYAVGATAIAGGALSLVYLAWHGGLRRALFNIVGALQGALLAASARTRPSLSIAGDASVGSLPYGVAIAAGTIGYLLLRQLGFLD